MIHPQIMRGTVTVTVQPVPVVSFQVAASQTGESAGHALITVTLSAPSGATLADGE